MNSYLYIMPFDDKKLIKIGVSSNTLARLNCHYKTYALNLENAYIIEGKTNRVIKALETELLSIFPPLGNLNESDGYTEIRKMKYLPEILSIIERKHPNLELKIKKYKDYKINKIYEVKTKKKRQNFRIFLSDYETLLKLRAFKVVKEHQVDFTFGDCISEGINLLAEKYDVARGMEKTNFRVGRRNDNKTEIENIKNTSTALFVDDLNLMSDVLYHKINVIGEMDYTVMQFVRDFVFELKRKYKNAF